MADEPRGPGAAGGPASDGAAELQGHDERRIVAFFHVDAGRMLDTLAVRTIAVGRLAEQVGPDACEAERRELRHLTELTIRLLRLQFADL